MHRNCQAVADLRRSIGSTPAADTVSPVLHIVLIWTLALGRCPIWPVHLFRLIRRKSSLPPLGRRFRRHPLKLFNLSFKLSVRARWLAPVSFSSRPNFFGPIPRPSRRHSNVSRGSPRNDSHPVSVLETDPPSRSCRRPSAPNRISSPSSPRPCNGSGQCGLWAATCNRRDMEFLHWPRRCPDPSSA